MKLFLDGHHLRVRSLVLAVSLVAAWSHQAHAAIVYSGVGSLFSENFDSLPIDAPNNLALQPSPYPEGWMDDTTTNLNHVSVSGWHLYHSLMPAGDEIGFNGHQRFRIGPGRNTGGFWGFASNAADLDKALGSIGSTTIATDNTQMYIAARLVNMTGVTLNSFSLTYDGEQWRDGESPDPETMVFDYSLTATTLDWFNPATPFTAVPSLNYTSPSFAGTANAGSFVDGNFEGRVPDLTATVTNISWVPGADLWLRWGDAQLAGGLADDGLGIDTVRFAAVPEPTSLWIAGLSAMAGFSRRQRG